MALFECLLWRAKASSATTRCPRPVHIHICNLFVIVMEGYFPTQPPSGNGVKRGNCAAHFNAMCHSSCCPKIMCVWSWRCTVESLLTRSVALTEKHDTRTSLVWSHAKEIACPWPGTLFWYIHRSPCPRLGLGLGLCPCPCPCPCPRRRPRCRPRPHHCQLNIRLDATHRPANKSWRHDFSVVVVASCVAILVAPQKVP